jgi:hypothetical protein
MLFKLWKAGRRGTILYLVLKPSEGGKYLNVDSFPAECPWSSPGDPWQGIQLSDWQFILVWL